MSRFHEWLRRGSSLIWLSGALLALSLMMISGLVTYIAAKGLGFFWPKSIFQVQTPDGPVLGEITDEEAAQGDDLAKVQFRVGNRDIYGQDFRWVKKEDTQTLQRPLDVVLIERFEYGVFMGWIDGLQKDGQPLSSGNVSRNNLKHYLSQTRLLQKRIRTIEINEVGELNAQLEDLRLQQRSLELKGDTAKLASLESKDKKLQEQYEALQKRLELLRIESKRLTLKLRTVDGQSKEIPLSSVVRMVPSNELGWVGKFKVYCSRLWEFLADDPRESNTEGGIFPALFGTVLMVLIMSIAVVPLGVMTAIFLREYAKDGWLVRIIRVAVNNLAGVPSIVFGVFGLGFFVYAVGGTLDQLFYAHKLPTPTFGTGGILWASMTLALLTVPVVIVATEEALGAVPRSLREGSLALGSTKWQTIWNVALPGAAPGILTGFILAMARGVGEVAPLMLTGVVKLAPTMPLDGQFPYLHLDRKFMHLGFHIYDVGFQSPNSEAAKPMVFMTTLLLLLVVIILNLFALRLRQRLRARLGGSTF